MEVVIDEKQVRTNAFVRKIMTNIAWTIVDSLDDIPENPQTIDLSLNQGASLAMTVDNQAIRMNPFVEKIIRNIIAGMVQSLDDIPENPQSVRLNVFRK